MPVIDPSSRIPAFLRTGQTDAPKAPPDPSIPEKPSQLDGRLPKNGDSLLGSLAMLEPQVQKQLLQRIRALSREDARQARKVFQLFMESVFKQQFSGRSTADIDWTTLTNPVIDQMEADQELLAAIKEAARHLVQAAAKATP